MVLTIRQAGMGCAFDDPCHAFGREGRLLRKQIAQQFISAISFASQGDGQRDLSQASSLTDLIQGASSVDR